MTPAPRRRTRATGFSPGGPRELKDAPRRHARGGRRTTAAGKAAPKAPSRTADPMDFDKVEDSESGADAPASPRRGRGQTRSLRARTRSSSPLVTTEVPDNTTTRSPVRDADAASQPRRARLGRGIGKHARVEDTLEEVVGPAEETGGESSRSSVARPAKKLRAGDRGGEAIRRQMEREKRLSPPPTAPAVTTPSGVRASVLRVGASALKYLGFRTESPRPVAEGDGVSSPSPEVSSHEAPLSTTESPSGQEVVKSTGGPVQPDGGALASAVLHERSGEDLIREQRRAADLRKLLKLGRRNVVPLKAPSECGSDDEEAAKAAYRFTEELRPVSLPSYDASTRYVGWAEGNSGMLVVEEEESDDSNEDVSFQLFSLFFEVHSLTFHHSARVNVRITAILFPIPLLRQSLLFPFLLRRHQLSIFLIRRHLLSLFLIRRAPLFLFLIRRVPLFLSLLRRHPLSSLAGNLSGFRFVMLISS